MKYKILVFIVMVMMLLTACGQNTIEQSLTLRDQNENEVTFPSDTPTLFFFITTPEVRVNCNWSSCIRIWKS